jgi:hypothetical protein
MCRPNDSPKEEATLAVHRALGALRWLQSMQVDLSATPTTTITSQVQTIAPKNVLPYTALMTDRLLSAQTAFSSKSIPFFDMYHILPVALLSVLILVIVQLRSRRARYSAQQPTEYLHEKRAREDVYDAIEPLPDFDWQNTPPLKIRPFKPKYHLTMGT